MADVKISNLPPANTPLSGTEVLPIVQSTTTKKVAVADLTAGRALSATSLTLTTTPLAVSSGGTGTATAFTAGSLVFAGASGTYTQNNTRVFWDNTNFRLGINTNTPAVTVAINGIDAMLLPKGENGDRPAGVAGYVRFNTTSNEFEGYNGTKWGSIGGGEIVNDTTTDATEYPIFANATSGNLTTAYVASTKLTFNPNTGSLLSTVVGASNGIVLNALAIAADYTIPSNYNGLSGGPVTVNSGVTVTVSSGSTWTVT